MTRRTRPRHELLRDAISVIPAIAVGATATCYALGLFIVNIFLNRYGVYTVEFVRSDFVLVGAVFIFLVVVATSGVEHGKAIWSQAPDIWRNKALPKRALRILWLVAQVFLAFVITPVIALSLLSRGGFELNQWQLWASAFILGGTGGHAGNLFRRAVQLLRDALDARDANSRSPQLMSQAYFAADVVLSLSLSVASYALITYPHLAPAFGGSHRDLVLLAPTPQGLDVARHLKLPIDADGNIGPLKLLTDNELEFVVVAGDTDSSKSRAIRIGRQHVNAVVALPPSRQSSNEVSSERNVPRGAIKDSAPPQAPNTRGPLANAPAESSCCGYIQPY